MRRAIALRAVAASLALALAGTACGPKAGLHVGLKNYNTDIVFGAKKKAPPTPPPLPVFEAPPTFPGFIEPPPALPILTPRVETVTTLPAPKARVVACPQADVFQIPPGAGTVITASPAQGFYPYRQTFQSDPNSKATPLPTNQVRQVTNVHKDSAGDVAWDVVVPGSPAGTTTTTSYAVINSGAGGSNSDGLYVTRVAEGAAGTSPQTFTPVDGLRIFPMPADSGLTWNSASTDPLTGTTQSLSGVIKERRRIDACGTVVEGWAAVADITIVSSPNGPGGPAHQSEMIATYIIAPQLGGLIIGDTIETKDGTQDATTESIINTTTPLAAAPK